jgi:hypothetical protein
MELNFKKFREGKTILKGQQRQIFKFSKFFGDLKFEAFLM